MTVQTTNPNMDTLRNAYMLRKNFYEHVDPIFAHHKEQPPVACDPNKAPDPKEQTVTGLFVRHRNEDGLPLEIVTPYGSLTVFEIPPESPRCKKMANNTFSILGGSTQESPLRSEKELLSADEVAKVWKDFISQQTSTAAPSKSWRIWPFGK